jgi:hypothetical protein
MVFDKIKSDVGVQFDIDKAIRLINPCSPELYFHAKRVLS